MAGFQFGEEGVFAETGERGVARLNGQQFQDESLHQSHAALLLLLHRQVSAPRAWLRTAGTSPLPLSPCPPPSVPHPSPCPSFLPPSPTLPRTCYKSQLHEHGSALQIGLHPPVPHPFPVPRPPACCTTITSLLHGKSVSWSVSLSSRLCATSMAPHCR